MYHMENDLDIKFKLYGGVNYLVFQIGIDKRFLAGHTVRFYLRFGLDAFSRTTCGKNEAKLSEHQKRATQPIEDTAK